MKAFFYIVLFILVFLAVSSGITKVLLMPHELEFFGKYGFTNPILITYGAFQLVGGVLLVIPKARITGAVVVAITFLISAVFLAKSGNIPVTIITLIAILLLGFVVKRTMGVSEHEDTNEANT